MCGIDLDPVLSQERPKFILEAECPMMRLLIAYVPRNLIEI